MGCSGGRLAEKNKKIQKKFCDKAVWGVLAYPTGGGAFGTAAKRNFHNRNGRCRNENFTPCPKRQNYFFSYFGKTLIFAVCFFVSKLKKIVHSAKFWQSQKYTTLFRIILNNWLFRSVLNSCPCPCPCVCLELF